MNILLCSLKDLERMSNLKMQKIEIINSYHPLYLKETELYEVYIEKNSFNIFKAVLDALFNAKNDFEESEKKIIDYLENFRFKKYQRRKPLIEKSKDNINILADNLYFSLENKPFIYTGDAFMKALNAKLENTDEKIKSLDNGEEKKYYQNIEEILKSLDENNEKFKACVFIDIDLLIPKRLIDFF